MLVSAIELYTDTQVLARSDCSALLTQRLSKRKTRDCTSLSESTIYITAALVITVAGVPFVRTLLGRRRNIHAALVAEVANFKVG